MMRPITSTSRWPLALAALLMLLVSLPACVFVVEEDPYYDDYYGHRWGLEVIVYYGRTYAPLDDAPYTLTLEADGRLDGAADCNTYEGTYDAPRSGTLSVQSITSTEQACGRGSLSGRYLEVLGSASSYNMGSDDLILTSRDGQSELRFRRL